MRTEKQNQASRVNGSRSHGPKTPEGKARSAVNAMRHGLLSQVVVLENEDPECFEKLFHMHVDRFSPVDDIEMGMIEEMSASYWRLRRTWAIESSLLDEAIARQPKEMDEAL